MSVLAQIMVQFCVIYSCGVIAVAFYIQRAIIRQPGLLDVLAYHIEDFPIERLTQRGFAWMVILVMSVLWPVVLPSLLDGDGPWRG